MKLINLDIYKCKGTDCPLKENCYRFTCKPNHWQSWFIASPFKDNKCDFYWKNNVTAIWKKLKNIYLR